MHSINLVMISRETLLSSKKLSSSTRVSKGKQEYYVISRQMSITKIPEHLGHLAAYSHPNHQQPRPPANSFQNYHSEKKYKIRIKRLLTSFY